MASAHEDAAEGIAANLPPAPRLLVLYTAENQLIQCD
jgi:hypothetical protein